MGTLGFPAETFAGIPEVTIPRFQTQRSEIKISYLVRGFPGHPLHPPLTDVAVGLYTGATAFAVLSALGVSEENLAHGWWLLVVAGLIVTVPTALTGLADWLTISRDTPLWRTATAHLLAMVTATVFSDRRDRRPRRLCRRRGRRGQPDPDVDRFVLLTIGGWLGGANVFTHGMRVLNLVDEPARRAVTPVHPEKEQAEA